MNNRIMPDYEARMEDVKELAEMARKREARTGATPALTAQPGVIAPIYMGKAHEVVPDRYVLHYSISVCSNCKAESRDSEFYALSYLRSRINGTRVRHLTRCDRPIFNLPVDRIPTGTHKVPFCCECETIDLSHLPPPPHESRLMDLPDPVLRGAKTAAGSKRSDAPAKSTKATLDDLI